MLTRHQGLSSQWPGEPWPGSQFHYSLASRALALCQIVVCARPGDSRHTSGNFWHNCGSKRQYQPYANLTRKDATQKKGTEWTPAGCSS